eukprot:CAMPEP_0176394358 /NCGR_PEP_ID=MMETSP0126-20121128/42502_1 /TAXON_ID=141414 ORGANISM="Strombidinopsis acuminatum, Strain SPMC142" /NCGR_SAMPLE_ID=MMETSP0126 /ASSEMBLY_ACC=CAM_ASM_000229 /LENGTH=102 /DNA_ID=CAMNT_0017766503 /DNA_START=304 /DNA_END=612 /DNA_ORIENTATION=+
MELLGENVGKLEAVKMLRNIDKDLDRKISFSEFSSACIDYKSQEADEMIDITFDKLDTDQSGQLSIDEIFNGIFKSSRMFKRYQDQFKTQLVNAKADSLNKE